MSADPPFIVPSDIPWSSLTDEDLEELLYWLLDAMGATELTWRAGGQTTNAADGGRDIEAVLHEPSDAGVLEPKRWWVEAKGRSRTVGKDAVTAAATNALAYPVDALIVATNARFTNPTRDWVGAFNATHQRPNVRLWDRDEFERLILRHPLIAARVLPGILSPAGAPIASPGAILAAT